MDYSEVENLVFEGGGMKGISFCGAILFLEESGMLSRIKRVIGSSAGALYATLVACKVNADTCRNIVENGQFKEINQGSWNVLSHMYRFMYTFGWYRPDKLYEWYDEVLKRIVGDCNITFGDLYAKTGIDLIVTGSNVSKKRKEYFSHKSHPKMQVVIALKISTCIPIVWPPILYEGCYYVDGAMLNSYPIWYFEETSEEPAFVRNDKGVFDDVRFDDKRSMSVPDKVIKTIGLKLVPSEEKISDKGDIDLPTSRISNLKEYVFSIVEAILVQLERAEIHKDYWRRTIIIPTSNVLATNFSLTKYQMDWLITSGYEACKKRMKG